MNQMALLMVFVAAGKKWTEIRPSCLKVFEEEIVWRAFTEFDTPVKIIPIG